MPHVESEGRRMSWRGWLALAFVAVAGLPTLLYRLGADQAMFSYIGREMLEGRVPYRDAWDIKPPGIFAVYALGHLLTPRFDLAPRLLELGAAVWTAYLLIVLCRKLGRADAGPYAAFFFGALYFFEFNFWSTAQAEGFSAPLTVLGIVLALDAVTRGPWAALASGVCFGLVACLKTPLLLYAVVPAVIVLRGPGRWRHGAWLVAGGLVAPLAFVAYFLAHGALPDLVNVFQVQRAYAQSSPGIGWARFNAVVFGLRDAYPYNVWGSVLALTAMAALPALRTQRFLWAWMAAFWVQLLLQNKYLEYHFVPWILPVAVCLGVLASEVRSRLARIPNVIPRALASTALAGLLALVVVRHLPYFVDAARIAMGAVPREAHDRGAVFHVFRYTDSQRAAEIVRSVTAPADRILVYAFDPSVYLMSGRRSMSRHVSNFPIRDADWFPAHVRTAFFEELCRDVVASPPRALVTDFFALQGFDRVTRDGREILRFCGLELDGAGVAGHFWVFRPSQPSPGPR